MEIYIIGGGASGVLCALELSKNKNHKVHIIEKNNKLMKKLLLTGNGSCNFTNDDFNDVICKYYNNDFLDKIYDKFNNLNLIEYMNDLGIYYTTREKFGKIYYYPYDFSSKSVYYNIYDKLIENNVDIIYEEEVINIENINNKYIVNTNKSNYLSDILIFATGGMSYKKTGSDGKIFDILKKLNVSIVTPIPSLCPLVHNENELNKFKGIRQIVKIQSYVNNNKLYEEIGEIQFNENNVSGIPILNVSQKIGREIFNNYHCKIIIDFLYDITDVGFLIIRKQNLKNKLIKNFLCGIIDERIALYIYKKIGLKNINVEVDNLTNDDINNIYCSLKKFEIVVTSLSSFDVSQVTKGGIDINEIDTNFQLKKYHNLFAIGEVVDIDGICGGYNLSYDFISGIVVGKFINKKGV